MVRFMAGCLCDSCAALCCRYFALPIDNPETRRDFDNIRWYLVHENVVVFVEKKQWYIGIMNRCKNLQPDNRCGIYETRPMICRSYSTDNCDYHGGDYNYERLFTSADALWDYALQTLKEARAGRRKKKAKSKHRRRAVRHSARPPLRLNGKKSTDGLSTTTSANGRTIALPLLRS
jgi:Fe-S-cluster containining protein